MFEALLKPRVAVQLGSNLVAMSGTVAQPSQAMQKAL